MKSITFAVRNMKELLRDFISYIFCLGLPIIMLVVMTLINQSIPQMEGAPKVFNIEKLTPEILRAFIKRIDVYEKEVRYSRTCGNTIVIQYTFQLDKN